MNGAQQPGSSTTPVGTPGLTQSASFGPSNGPSNENQLNLPEIPMVSEQPKFFFNEKYAKLGVKGNFMPLAAQPVNVDLADWLAHQSKLTCSGISQFGTYGHSGRELSSGHNHCAMCAGGRPEYQEGNLQHGYLPQNDGWKV